jgi:hypothetical protein
MFLGFGEIGHSIGEKDLGGEELLVLVAKLDVIVDEKFKGALDTIKAVFAVVSLVWH